VDFQGKNVLDYGAGTGILAILASKMGCDHADAIDIEHESFTNMSENFLINSVKNVRAIHGTLDNLDPKGLYDVILANINRNVLLQSAQELYALLKVEGKLLLSGILLEDTEMILSVYTSLGFEFEYTLTENKWACIQFIRK
jgi:ribosomal protein L11 methyltransferase